MVLQSKEMREMRHISGKEFIFKMKEMVLVLIDVFQLLLAGRKLRPTLFRRDKMHATGIKWKYTVFKLKYYRNMFVELVFYQNISQYQELG